MYMRRFAKQMVSGILAVILLFSGSAYATEEFAFKAPEQSYDDFTEYQGIKIFVNGRYVEFNDDLGYPIIIKGRTYIPVRVVSDTLNAYVYWWDVASSVFVKKHEKSLNIKPGRNYIGVNNLASDAFHSFISDYENHVDDFGNKVDVIPINEVPFVKNGRTYVPFRALFEAFDMTVIWDGDTKTIYAMNDYENNTECIDFKSYSVVSIGDVDLNKEYDKIIYDGQEIDKNYIKILQNCDQYKVLIDGDTLNIFSYQYLFDLNYLYRAHIWCKNDKTGDGYNSRYGYQVHYTNEAEKELVTNLGWIDRRSNGVAKWNLRDDSMQGKSFVLGSPLEAENYVELDKVVDALVDRICATAKSDEEKVIMANNELCDLLEYAKDDDGAIWAYGLYDSLVVHQRGSCGDYAMAFKYLMDKMGINCMVATGWTDGGEPHAWNEVLIDGAWKIVDVTWNDGIGTNINPWLLADYTESPSEITPGSTGNPVGFGRIDYSVTRTDGYVDNERFTSAAQRSYERLVKYTLKLHNAS